MDTLLDRAVARLDRLPLFSRADYASLNADVARSGTDLVRHALVYGCAENRQVLRRGRLARVWGETCRRASHAPAMGGGATASLPSSASIFVSSWSGPATKALAHGLVRDLTSRGVAGRLETERSVPDVIPDAAIVVAPHEFFRLGLGPAWRKTALARSALMLNTALPSSDDFIGALPCLLGSLGVLDLSPQMVDIFARADIPTALIRPSLPLKDVWLEAGDEENPLIHALPVEAREPGVAAQDPRPIDISFLGSHTAWRGECLARIAPELTRYRTVFRLHSSVPDLSERRALDRADFRLSGHIAARSKLTLQLAGFEIPSLDWLATFRSMAAGAVVVTDCATPHPEFRSGTHFFHEDSRHLPDLVRWLLDDAEGRAAAEAARSMNQTILADHASGTNWTAQAAVLWGMP